MSDAVWVELRRGEIPPREMRRRMDEADTLAAIANTRFAALLAEYRALRESPRGRVLPFKRRSNTIGQVAA